jgi:hypothetical protein
MKLENSLTATSHAIIIPPTLLDLHPKPLLTEETK